MEDIRQLESEVLQASLVTVRDDEVSSDRELQFIWGNKSTL